MYYMLCILLFKRKEYGSEEKDLKRVHIPNPLEVPTNHKYKKSIYDDRMD